MEPRSEREHRLSLPPEIVERAGALATVLDVDRTEHLARAVREYVEAASHPETVEQEIAGAYYDGEIDDDQLTALLGREKAENVRVLDEQLSEEFIEEVANEFAEE